LGEAGFAVLLVDYLSAEGVLNTCSGEIELTRVAQYIGAALRFAATHDEVDRSRIHLIGWSYGGAGLLRWLRRPENEDLVKSAVAIYPGCGGAEPWKSSVPLLMLLAGADDIAPPVQCESLVRSLPESTQVQLHSYPGARHGFDLAEAPPVLDLGGGISLGGSPDAAQDAWRRLLAYFR
jgi:dienelactone hydrolase